MGKRRWIEFFEDEGSHLSMPRLLMFISFWPSTYVVLKTQNENIFGWYLSAYAAAYGVGKLSNALGGRNANKLGVE